MITLVDKPFFLPQPIQPVDYEKSRKTTVPNTVDKDLFNQVLQKEIDSTGQLKFSRHAQERINSRQINLDQNHLLRLKEAVEKHKQKEPESL